MAMVGVLARFEFTDGDDPAVAEFFGNGVTIVEGQPPTTLWFAYRIGPTAYGAFASFANEADRAALLAAGGPKLSAEHADLFTAAPTFELVDIVEARLPPD